MKKILFTLALLFCGCDLDRKPHQPEKIAVIGSCEVWRIYTGPVENDIYTTICSDGRASTQQKVPVGKTTREIRIDTVQK